MSSPTQPTHRISGPAELLDAVPYLLGFHPTESLVLVGVNGGLLGVAARLDLVDAGQPDLVEHTLATLRRGGADQLVLVVFDDGCEPQGAGRRERPRPWADAVLGVAEAAIGVGTEVEEALLVCRGRWWSYLCDVEQCCPSEGIPLADSPSPFAAASAVDGVVALPSRAALAETLAPLPEAQRAVLQPLIDAAEHATVAAMLEDRRSRHERGMLGELMLAARASATGGWQPPDDDTVARLAVALVSYAVRDEVWIALDAGRLDGRPLWTELARRCPAPYDAAPLFLLAWANWRAGSGVLAAMAVERVVESDPTYSAADLLLAVLAHAIDPRTFPRLGDAGLTPGVTAPRRRARRAAATRTRR